MEQIIHNFARAAKLVTEGMAVLVVAYGVTEAFVRLLRLLSQPSATIGVRKQIWRRFGTWLLLGLEFALAADIIGSVVSPTWADIGELAAIAVIRTFLNYFLEHDLEHVAQEEVAPSTEAVSRREAA